MKELREMLRRQTGICEDTEGVRVLAWMVTTGEVGPRCPVRILLSGLKTSKSERWCAGTTSHNYDLKIF